jgi:dTDP-4-amino-4,6-dideoxygalactose transaminase
MTDHIYLSPPDITEHEEQAVLAAIRSGWIAPVGPDIDAFEREIAEFVGRDHAVALASGTAALHLGLLDIGARPGTVVLAATMTFAATANAIVYTGATPVFVDCDDTGNLSPSLLERAIEAELARGSTIVAVLPVDLFGKPADYASIGLVAGRHDIPVLSDAAESLGAVRQGLPAGKPGLAAAISFNGNKIMTTSGGGMLVTDDARMAARARYLSTQARQPVTHYEHTDIGYNYRLSNLLAALGRAQLVRLPQMIERRRQNRLWYRELVDGIPGVSIFGGEDGSTSAAGDHDNFWLTSILVDEDAAGWSARQLREHLGRLDIEARPLWKPMHLQPVFAGARAYTDGTAERLFDTGLSLPTGSTLTSEQRGRIAAGVEEFVRTGSDMAARAQGVS